MQLWFDLVFLNKHQLFQMFFLVYVFSITTATEPAQVLPRRKTSQGELQLASETPIIRVSCPGESLHQEGAKDWL